MSGSSWSEQRRDAAEERAELLARRQRSETARAAALLQRFATAAREARLPTEHLRVQGYGGRGSARGDKLGWYLRGDCTVAVGADGEFYVLTASLGLMDRLRGVTLHPSEPPLVIGAGGKDGDSLSLAAALERLLPGWDAEQPR
ncbi:hypothetical protein [Georgenia subflava]|uniref:Uncharacterized protein n=1 Tax=Georgenia subflava TaxID=1622177 RepID=A0A6N7ELY9_9MICO|nr:hypothetical protein [Georgenia subflava]MPV38138.1 hypothetical protein [Georgenia subflava]